MWFQIAVTFAFLWVYRAVTTIMTKPKLQDKAATRRVIVVLGSGGHTGEMIMALRQIPKKDWAIKLPLYVVSDTDKNSEGVARRFEMEHLGRKAHVAKIPRAREVGQSYVTSVWSTLRAFASAVKLVFEESPDVIITNGPGVCVPIVAANLLVAIAMPMRPRAKLAYFESFTCVDHLSVSGALLRPVTDCFTVQWPGLTDALRFGSTAHYCGPFLPQQVLPPLLPDGFMNAFDERERRSVVITVGSTKFDDLIATLDTFSFYDALVQLRINHVLIQKGESAVEVNHPHPTMLMSRRVVSYKDDLAKDIREAALVISHAGAGTILEAMAAGVPTIVVPNTKLMSNHQLQLAHALATRRHLFCLPVDQVVSGLLHQNWKDLVKFPPPNTAAIQRHLVSLLA
jgi:beta-1,4-N-acetylglucosaminyltransferase